MLTKITEKVYAVADTHIGVKGALEKLAALVREILEKTKPGDLIVWCGDLTNLGREREWLNFIYVIKPILRDRENMFLPGNHDIALWNGIGPPSFRKRRRFRYFTNVNSVLQGHRYGVVGLSTTETTVRSIGAQGKLGSGQLDALDNVLEAAIKPLVLCMHHKPIWERPGLRLHDADEFKEVLSRHHGKVKRIVCGHRHTELVISAHDGWPEIISLPSVAYP